MTTQFVPDGEHDANTHLGCGTFTGCVGTGDCLLGGAYAQCSIVAQYLPTSVRSFLNVEPGEPFLPTPSLATKRSAQMRTYVDPLRGKPPVQVNICLPHECCRESGNNHLQGKSAELSHHLQHVLIASGAIPFEPLWNVTLPSTEAENAADVRGDVFLHFNITILSCDTHGIADVACEAAVKALLSCDLCLLKKGVAPTELTAIAPSKDIMSPSTPMRTFHVLSDNLPRMFTFGVLRANRSGSENAISRIVLRPSSVLPAYETCSAHEAAFTNQEEDIPQQEEVCSALIKVTLTHRNDLIDVRSSGGWVTPAELKACVQEACKRNQ